MADEMSDKIKMQKDLLWGVYSDVRAHSRHAETLRSSAVNYIFIIASALVAVIISDGNVRASERPLCLMVALIGLFGLAFVGIYTELYQRNYRRAIDLRNELDSRFFDGSDSTLAKLIASADSRHEATPLYRSSRRLLGSAHRFWLLLPGLVLVAGLVLMTLSA
ncbi:hypothetical protein [Phytohabitans houttuyneae]|uniref:Uncharacterized protein n=1 Tax=Phytohabitans houttuyneae TaxID=1076126 RepID=A0A6V8K9N3_9ACTN|nr:hypothetical protein [Phytohabitans houttuyneae]GFJ81923.1 hypothetical protein Phou_061030 [Phytohabitans houttuyneae]